MYFLTPRVYAVLPSGRRGNLVALLNLVLALAKGGGGACSPPQPWLAERCGISVPTVRRCEKVLRELELVECDHHARGNRRILRPNWERLREIAGLERVAASALRAVPRESAITPARTVENSVRGTRAHSARNWTRHAEAARVARPRPQAARTDPALEHARANVLFGSGIAADLRPHAAELVRAITEESGTTKAAAWLQWLWKFNRRRFEDLDRRGRVTLGALRKRAGWVRQGSVKRAPRRLADVLTALLPFPT